jgi:3-oxoacyl-[acyl-carrier protein] reductase
MEWNSLIKGKVAYITGSTRGIGWSVARLFASHGASIVLNGRSQAQLLEQRVEEIKQTYGVACVGAFGDVSKADDVKSSTDLIFKTFKRLDILVNNAGILRDAFLGMIPVETMEEVLAVNTLGSLLNLQAAARLMGRNKSGSIINIASISGMRGIEGQSLYSASKTALIGMTMSAAKELAPSGIRVNAIAPGYIETDMTKALPPDKQQNWLASIGLSRAGQPEDVANAALFLASDMSSYITGQVIGVNGGLLI